MVNRRSPAPAGSSTRADDLPRLVVGPIDDPPPTATAGSTPLRGVDAYYSQTAEDYRLWSPRLNMHFGFWKPGMSLVDREAMLEQMNTEVFGRLRTRARPGSRVLDMGCGVGTVARSLSKFDPASRPIGITAVPSQAARAATEAARDGDTAPPIVIGDFCSCPFPDGSFDAVYSVESSCYAPGTSKLGFLREAARLIRPGGRLAVADAFLKSAEPACPVSRAAHRQLCELWALETLGHLDSFVDAAESVGFDDVEVEDISTNVLPSALHAPAVMAGWAAGIALGGPRRIDAWRWRNALVGFPLAIFATDTTAGGYYIISATRRRR
jgi:SAM-dependent methyltransferase